MILQATILLLTAIAVGITRWLVGGSFAKFVACYALIGLLVTLNGEQNARRCGAGMPLDWNILWRIPSASMAWPAILARLYSQEWKDCQAPDYDADWDHHVHPHERSV